MWLINGTSLADERDSMMGIATFRLASDFYLCAGDNLCANISLPKASSYAEFL